MADKQDERQDDNRTLAGLAGEIRAFAPAILDQGVWSLAGFVASALVGRLLGAEALGVFAIGTAIIFAAGGVVNSLVLDPAAVIGPRDHDRRLKSYGGVVLIATAALGVVAVVAGVVTLITTDGEWGWTVAVSLFSTLPILVAWASRRLPYLTSEPVTSLVGTTAYLMAVIVGIMIADRLDALTVTAAIALLGVGGLVQALVVIPRWHPRYALIKNGPVVRRIAREHWVFGRWYLAAEAASWMLNYGLAAISAAVIGLGPAGAFRASQVLLRPYGVVFVGMGLAYLPRLTRIYRDHSVETAELGVRRIGWILSGVGAVVFSVLVVAGDQIMGLVFGPEFSEYGWLVAALGGAMIFHGWIAAYSMGLQASNHPSDPFFGQAAGAVVALAGGLTLGWAWGLVGFAVTFVLASLVRLLTVGVLFRRHSGRP